MFSELNDTIVAISSPAGASLRGILRLSGPRAFELAAGVFQRADLQPFDMTGGHERHFGQVTIAPDATVPAEAYSFRAPASYTRQDLVELHIVGSPPVLAMLLDLLVNRGARLAEPGEFTARAYFAGAMDLTEVEGVAAMIHARNDSQLRASEALLHGRLSRVSTQLRDRLADLLALVEAEIDFVEESIQFVTPQQVLAELEAVDGVLIRLLEEAPAVERMEVLPQVMLVGRPNAGKSTLFNRLTGMDRAIQSATAGTTRDIISAPLTLPGGELLLLDSAGIDEDAGPDARADGGIAPASESMQDDPAALAQETTRRAWASADVLLLVVDATDQPRVTVARIVSRLPPRPMRIVLNKLDRLSTAQRADLQIAGYQGLAVSAATGEGIEALRRELDGLLFTEAEPHGADVLALSHRQQVSLRDAHDALVRAREICRDTASVAASAELIAMEVRESMNALSLLVGEVSTDELLSRIFSRFCIGK